MHAPVLGRTVGVALCKAWGLDPDIVSSFTITVRPDDTVQVTVDMALSPYGADGLVHEVTQYQLVKDNG